MIIFKKINKYKIIYKEIYLILYVYGLGGFWIGNSFISLVEVPHP